jgi:hypothetical protein
MISENLRASQPRYARMPANPPPTDRLIECIDGWLGAIAESAQAIRSQVGVSVELIDTNALVALASRLREIELAMVGLAEMLESNEV